MDSATNSASDAAAAGIFGGLILIIIVVTIALVVFFVWLFWRIFARTGMNGALGLLCLVPYVGPLICLLMLAFSRWPIEDAMAAHGIAPPAPGTPGTPPGTSVMPT
jgi:uncharacterized membrane protein